MLNTASRIQARCNEFGVNLLLSEALITALDLAATPYIPQKIGDVQLKGKEHIVPLYTVINPTLENNQMPIEQHKRIWDFAF